MTYGVQRLLEDLTFLKYENVVPIRDTDNKDYVMIPNFEVQIGRFADRVIDLAIPAPTDFPRTVGASIHVRCSPQLLENQNVPEVRNIVDSKLGTEWKYWSFRFTATEEDTAKNLMEEINGVFRKI